MFAAAGSLRAATAGAGVTSHASGGRRGSQ